MATQTPKRVVYLLDLSGNMIFDGKIDIAKSAIITLLDSMIPEDYVVSGVTTTYYKCECPY
jgi:hypothetical protein